MAIPVVNQGAGGGANDQTYGDLTYYVRTTGNDSNDGLSVGSALLTPQAGVNKLPKLVKSGHTAKVDLGDGDLGAGADVADFTVEDGGKLLIEGDLGAPTLTTGTASGTATGGTTTLILNDSLQAWTVDELKGMMLLVGGNYREIYSNTATQIVLHKAMPGMGSGSAYEIEIPTTRITSGAASGFGIRVSGCYFSDSADIEIRNIQVEGTLGFQIGNGGGGSATRIRLIGTTYGFYSVYTSHRYEVETMFCSGGTYGLLLLSSRCEKIDDCYCYNNSSFGLYGGWTQYLHLENLAISDSGYRGLEINSCAYFDPGKLLIEDCAGHGLVLDSQVDGGETFFTTDQGVEINGCGDSAIYIGYNSKMRVNEATGSGNTNYGVEVINGSSFVFGTGTTLTGTIADATIDGGTTTLDWATDFATDEDVVSNITDGTRIKRVD